MAVPQIVPYKDVDKQRAYVAAWKRDNAHAPRAHNASRRTAKLLRQPVWSEKQQIRAVYKCAARLTKCLQTQFHVDHILPLQGQLVSGLHVMSNLQVISAAANSRKKNIWKPEDGA